jgi:hypothetical protein
MPPFLLSSFIQNTNKLLSIQCFFSLLLFSNPSFILLLTSFTHWPYSSNIMPGSFLLPTSSLVSMEFSTVFTNPIPIVPRNNSLWRSQWNRYQSLLPHFFRHSQEGNFQQLPSPMIFQCRTIGTTSTEKLDQHQMA